MAREEYERYFTEGTEVEVRMQQQEGFRGPWYTATVIKAPFSDALLKSVLVTIEYKDLMEDNEDDEEEGTENAEKPQKEKDEDEGSENAKKRLRETVDVVRIRPIPPWEAKIEFKLNNMVDVFTNDGWWEGLIRKVFGNGRFEVFVMASTELIEVREEDLRMHWEWVYGHWIPPLLNEEESSSSTTDPEVLRTKFLLHAAIRNAKEVMCFPVKWNIIISQLEGLASCFVSSSALNGAISEVFTLADRCIRHRYEDTQRELDSLLEKLSSQMTGSELVDDELLKNAEMLLPSAISLAKEVKEYKKRWNMVVSKLENISSGLVSNISTNVLKQLVVIMDTIELAEKTIGKLEMQSNLDSLVRKINLILNDCCPTDGNLMVDRMASPDMADKIHKLVRNASNVKQCKIGVRASASSIKNETAEVIVIAADTMQYSFLHLRELAKEHQVAYVFVASSELLGVSCQVGKLGKLGTSGKLRKDKRQRGVYACSVVRTEGSCIGKEIREVKKELGRMGN